MDWEAQNPWGALHIIVEDGNLSDADLAFCEELPDITEEEREFLRELRALSEDERLASWEAWLG